MSEETTLFDDRIAFIKAAMQSDESRKRFMINQDPIIYGLAKTEHQFIKEVVKDSACAELTPDDMLALAMIPDE